MPSKLPKHEFLVDRGDLGMEGDVPEDIQPDILDPHPVNKDSIAKQLKDNFKPKITPTEISFSDRIEF